MRGKKNLFLGLMSEFNGNFLLLKFCQIIVVIFLNFVTIAAIAIATPSHLAPFPQSFNQSSFGIVAMSDCHSTQNFSEIHSLIERQAKAWESSNADQVVADFAEDSLFIVPGSTLTGKSAIADAAKGYFANFTDIKIEIKQIIIQENKGAVEWTWEDKNKNTSEKSYAEDAIIFELENHKIKYWREYIDKKEQK